MPRVGPMLRFQVNYQIDTESGCWVWIGSRDGQRHRTGHPQGDYGRFFMNGKYMGAQRASWILHHGPIPKGLWVLHRCDNPPCVNPAHLFLGTNLDNQYDARRKGRAWFQQPNRRSPRTGTGVGRVVPGKGCVVNATCAICGVSMVQRITANRQGKTPVCSQTCKNTLTARRGGRGEVDCANCGKRLSRRLSQLRNCTRSFCNYTCSGQYYSRHRRGEKSA